MIRKVLKSRLLGIEEDLKRSFPDAFMVEKKDLLDIAFTGRKINKVADLGCVWGVDCAYGLYVLDKYQPEHIVMVDTHWTEAATRFCSSDSRITFLKDNFGSAGVPAQLGNVDSIILFDVLLHQVAPNWDRILQMYAPYTQSFVIFNPQYTGDRISVRLLDLGFREYFENIPHTVWHPDYEDLFLKMWEMHPEHERIWRDVHHVWQWGITDHDLLDTMEQLGFVLTYFRNHGKFGNLKNFENGAFIFFKR
jgi:hypothetical protein